MRRLCLQPWHLLKSFLSAVGDSASLGAQEAAGRAGIVEREQNAGAGSSHAWRSHEGHGQDVVGHRWPTIFLGAARHAFACRKGTYLKGIALYGSQESAVTFARCKLRLNSVCSSVCRGAPFERGLRMLSCQCFRELSAGPHAVHRRARDDLDQRVPRAEALHALALPAPAPREQLRLDAAPAAPARTALALLRPPTLQLPDLLPGVHCAPAIHFATQLSCARLCLMTQPASVCYTTSTISTSPFTPSWLRAVVGQASCPPALIGSGLNLAKKVMTRGYGVRRRRPDCSGAAGSGGGSRARRGGRG